MTVVKTQKKKGTNTYMALLNKYKFIAKLGNVYV